MQPRWDCYLLSGRLERRVVLCRCVGSSGRVMGRYGLRKDVAGRVELQKVGKVGVVRMKGWRKKCVAPKE